MTELIDLVDKEGTVVIKKVPRTQATAHSDLYMQIVIGVIFNRSGKVLVHKRSAKKKVNPGDIDHVCGGILCGESPTEAFVRESQEETGIIPTDIHTVHEGINAYRKYRYLLLGFLMTCPQYKIF